MRTNHCITKTYFTGVVSLSALLSSPPLFGWGEYAYIPIQSFCFCDWANHMSYAFFMICCCFGGPFSVMTVCNIFIYRTVRASRRAVSIRVNEASSAITSKQERTIKNKQVEDDFDSPDTGNHMTEDIDSHLKGVRENDGCVTITNNMLHPKWAVQTEKQNEFDKAKHEIDAGTDYEVSDNSSANNNEGNENRISKTSASMNFSKMSSKSKVKRREEHRFAITLIVVVIVFVICWLPYCISMLLSIFCEDPVPREFHMFTLVIGYANSCCNPIIYGLMNKRFATGFRDLYCFWKKKFRMPITASP